MDSSSMLPTRRELLAGASAALAASPLEASSETQTPNVVVIISDQFRADCIGALGTNPMNLTPNLDRMASRGVLFRSAMTNQPVCAPARATIFTGQYPSRHGVWKNDIGLAGDAATLATEMRRRGYSTNYIGKWHLAGPKGTQPSHAPGPVLRDFRGGFQDLWEASNVLEFTSHAYEGDLFDADCKPIHFSGQYRVDFMTERAQRFLRSARSPFLLAVSYLEVHHQNDSDTYDPPKEYAGRYPNPFIPGDLRALPGNWPSHLADYYACVARIDDAVGTIRATLAETGLDKNTILAFVSDHGCHFRTRNTEYKRSAHDSSLHVPLIIEGPGFNRGLQIPELVSLVDLTPSLLESTGVPVPQSMQGRSFLPLLDRKTGAWRNEVFFEMSEFLNGRGIRTPQYTYAAVAPPSERGPDNYRSDRFVQHVMYDNYADPYQLVNLAGRAPYLKVAEELRQRLAARAEEAGGAKVTIEPTWFPYA